MTQIDDDAPDSRPRRSRVAKSTKVQESKSKVKISAYVSVESARRLGIHATMTDQDKSTIIESLIRDASARLGSAIPAEPLRRCGSRRRGGRLGGMRGWSQRRRRQGRGGGYASAGSDSRLFSSC